MTHRPRGPGPDSRDSQGPRGEGQGRSGEGWPNGKGQEDKKRTFYFQLKNINVLQTDFFNVKEQQTSSADSGSTKQNIYRSAIRPWTGADFRQRRTKPARESRIGWTRPHLSRCIRNQGANVQNQATRLPPMQLSRQAGEKLYPRAALRQHRGALQMQWVGLGPLAASALTTGLPAQPEGSQEKGVGLLALSEPSGRLTSEAAAP